MKYQVTRENLIELAKKKGYEFNNLAIAQLIKNDAFKYPGMGGLPQFILDCVERQTSIRGIKNLGLSREAHQKLKKSGELNDQVEDTLSSVMGDKQVAKNLIQAWGQNALGVLPNILLSALYKPRDPYMQQIILIGQPRAEDVFIEVIVEKGQVYLEVYCDQIPIINTDTDVGVDSTTFIPGPMKSRFVLVPPKGSQLAYFEFEKFETENEEISEMLNDKLFSEQEIKENYCNRNAQKDAAQIKRVLGQKAQLKEEATSLKAQLEVEKKYHAVSLQDASKAAAESAECLQNLQKENEALRAELLALSSKATTASQPKTKMQTQDKKISLDKTILKAIEHLEKYQKHLTTELTSPNSKCVAITESNIAVKAEESVSENASKDSYDYKTRKGLNKYHSCEVLLDILKKQGSDDIEKARSFKTAFIQDGYRHAKILNMNRTHPALRWIKQIISFVPEAFSGLSFLGISKAGKDATATANDVIRDFNTVERRGGVSR